MAEHAERGDLELIAFGAVVRELRKQRNWSITQVPGVSSSTLDAIEKGQRANITWPHTLRPLASAFGLRVSDLWNLVEQRIIEMSGDGGGEYFGA